MQENQEVWRRELENAREVTAFRRQTIVKGHNHYVVFVCSTNTHTHSVILCGLKWPPFDVKYVWIQKKNANASFHCWKAFCNNFKVVDKIRTKKRTIKGKHGHGALTLKRLCGQFIKFKNLACLILLFCYTVFYCLRWAHPSRRHLRHQHASPNQWLIDWPSSRRRHASVSLTLTEQKQLHCLTERARE